MEGERLELQGLFVRHQKRPTAAMTKTDLHPSLASIELRERKKNWHRKTRSGCLGCRRRRVKCDESQPSCKACAKRNIECEYPSSEPRWLSAKIPCSPKRTESFHDQQHFHYYMCTGAPIMAKWQSPSWWLATLPAASERSPMLRNALLALSVTTQQYGNISIDKVRSLRQIGQVYYTRACTTLKSGSNVTLEEALHASFAFAGYEAFLGCFSDCFIHFDAATKMYQSLLDDYPNCTTWSSDLTRSSRKAVLETAESFFRDIHFPLTHPATLQLLRSKASTINTASVVDPDAQLPAVESFLDLVTPERIKSFYWLVVLANSDEVLEVVRRALVIGLERYNAQLLPWSTEQEIFHNTVEMIHAFVELQRLEYSKRPALCTEVDFLMLRMIDLTEINMRLWTTERQRTCVPAQSNLADGGKYHQPNSYTGILGWVGQRARNERVRARAFEAMASHGMPESEDKAE